MRLSRSIGVLTSNKKPVSSRQSPVYSLQETRTSNQYPVTSLQSTVSKEPEPVTSNQKPASGLRMSCPEICLQVKNKNYSFPQSNPHATHEVLLRKTFAIRNKMTNRSFVLLAFLNPSLFIFLSVTQSLFPSVSLSPFRPHAPRSFPQTLSGLPPCKSAHRL